MSTPACTKPVIAVAVPMAVALAVVSVALAIAVYQGGSTKVVTVTVTATNALTEVFEGISRSMPMISIVSVSAKAKGESLLFDAYLVNSREGGDKLIKIEAVLGGRTETRTLAETIPGNYRGWITVEFDNRTLRAVPGSTVDFKLYFEKSGVHTFRVVVSP